MKRTFRSAMSVLGLLMLLTACSGFKTKIKYVDSLPSGASAGAGSGSQLKVCTDQPTIGRTTLQRLNRTEYNNTLRDLLGIQSRPADAFPADAGGEWFDNNADALSLNSLQLDLYFQAAESSIEEAFKANRARFMICSQTTTACATQILKSFAERAFRRPVTTAEVTELVGFIAVAQGQGESFETGIKLAMRAALVSPNFLYRGIKNPAPESATSVVELDDYELASRISYLLWSSMPDDELFAAARGGTLKTPETIAQQVRRMLKDPKAMALVESFGTQWLGLPLLAKAHPDTAMFPQFSEALRGDMMTETRTLLRDLVFGDLNPEVLLKADTTYVNSRLAEIYGISGVTGLEFQRVNLAGLNRQGVLSHAGILTMTSHAQQPSIVFRGKFVLKNLLCDMPPPPPANIPKSEGSEVMLSAGRLSNPNCMACHQRLDPIGRALHNFSALGGWRMNDEAGQAIDGIGSFHTGKTFRGPLELSDAIAEDDRFRICVAKKLLSYALARDVTKADDCAASQVAADAVSGKKFSDVILSVVNNPAFRKQSGGGQ